MSTIDKRFRTSSGLDQLKKFLPNELVYTIYPYIYDTNYNKKNLTNPWFIVH